MQKWGKDAHEKIRFRCKFCNASRIRKRSDLSKKYRKELFVKWLLGKQSLEEIAHKYKVSTKTIYRWFKPFWHDEPLPEIANIANQVLVIDGKYIDKNATVLVGTVGKKVVFWLFVQRENYNSWRTFLSSFKHIPLAITCDGQKGMLKAIREVFSRVIVQRCQFHVIKYCRTKLTQNPESIAVQELRILVLQISKIKTKEELRIWLEDYKLWLQNHLDFVKEKTYSENSFTPTRRKRWHYTHKNLHASYSHIKNTFPYLFRCLQHPTIPNTTNFVEGVINAPMQEKLRFHRGLKLPKRRILITQFLSSKQPKKPTQNVY